MKTGFVLLSLLLSTAAFAGSTGDIGSGGPGQIAALQKCTEKYARDKVEEYNLPNEALISTSAEARKEIINVIHLSFNPTYAAKAEHVLNKAQAVGLVIQYSDEIQFIYVGVSVDNGQCKVVPAAELNTANISGSDLKLKPSATPVFFLGRTKSELKKKFGSDSTVDDIFDAVVESLGY